MESLYTKYRPQTFQDVVGQQVVVSTLENAVLEGRIGHAYLFCGPRGTGKTTMARLLAKALMCQKGAGKLPDGTCEECKLIAAGEHPDVYELDAASRTGVDNVREEIINRVSYAPVRGRHKVYIIDEVHMLTTAAFNALLKTLEEPPEHVVFILCTTDPQKVPATIISRVQRFDFHSIGNDDIRDRLAFVCQHEGFEYDDEALDLVVRHARGGMRDALSTLEQLSVFGNGKVSVDAARDMLGSVPGSALAKVCEAMAARDVKTLFAQVGELVDSGRDLLQFVRELAAHVRDVYVACAVGTSPDVIAGTPDELERLSHEAQSFGSVDRVAHVLTVLGDASNEMRTATNQRLSLEIAFTRIARPESDLTLDALADRVAVLEQELRDLRQNGVAVAAVPAGSAAAATAPVVSTSAIPASAQAASAQARVSAASAAAPMHAPMPASSPKPQASNASQVQRPVAASAHSSAAGVHSAAVASAPSIPQNAAAKKNFSAVASGAASSNSGVAAPDPAVSTKPASNATGVANAADATSATAIEDPGELQRLWKQTVETLVHKTPSRGSLLISAHILSDDGSTLTVALPKNSTFAMKMLERSDVRLAIDPVVAQVFGAPRQVNYVEESLASAGRSGQRPAPSASRQRSAAPSRPVSRPAAPAAGPAAPASGPAAPAPIPQPAAQAGTVASQAGRSAAPAPARPAAKPSVPAARPMGNQQQPAAGQKPAQSYDMPWDPVPAAPGQQQATSREAAAPSASQAPSQGVPEDVPPYEEVPYDDADAMNYGDDAQMYGDVPAPAAKPTGPAAGGANFSTGAPAQRTFGQPATAGAGSNAAAPNGAGSNDAGAGAGANGGVSASGAAAGSAPVPPEATFDASSVPDDIPDDLRAIIEDAFEVFGDGVKVSSVEPAPTDEELSEGLDAGEMDDEDESNDSDDVEDGSGDGFVDDAEADDDGEADG